MKKVCFVCEKIFDCDENDKVDEEYWLCGDCKLVFENDLRQGLNQVVEYNEQLD